MSTQTAEILMDDEDLAPDPEAPDDGVAAADADRRRDASLVDGSPIDASTTDAATIEASAADSAAARRGADAEDVARLVPLVEGLLFAAGAPVPVARLVDALDGPERRLVVRALELLGDRLEEDARGLRLVRVAGGYQLRTLAEHGPWIRRLLGGKPPRLSRAMLETLAIIAYRQPCTKPEIEAIRGVDVDAVLSTLLERRMIRIVGRKEAPGRPILYGTTKEFLEVFSLPDLEALPPLKDVSELAESLVAPVDGEESAVAAPPIDGADACVAVEAADAAPTAPEDDDGVEKPRDSGA